MPTKDETEFDLITDLRKYIRSSGVSLSKLGRMCDLNMTQIYRFMSGERGLNIAAIDKLCKTLKLRLRPDQPDAPGKPNGRRKGKA